MLMELKTFDVNGTSIEEMISIRAFGRSLRAEYADHKVRVPKWIGPTLKSLDLQIAMKNAEGLEARRAEAR
jgi:hypothetical protein